MSWRSLLYVPANVPRFVEKAQERGADALILDLEDSVPADQKDAARTALRDRWESLRVGASDLIVRINADLLETARDLDAAVRPGLSAVYLPKARGVSMIGWLDAALTRLETARDLPPGGIGIVPLLEDPGALEKAFEIAAAPRVCALSLGAEDYATACGMAPTPEALLYARQRVVAAAHAAGVAPLGLLDTVARLDHGDLEGLARQSRAFGFAGASAVHPAAVPALNTGFAPAPQDVSWATAVLAALETARSEGRGAARLDGSMIDEPIARRARAILARTPPDDRETPR